MSVKVNFTDFWSDFNYSENYFTALLGNRIDFEISKSPDVLFYSFAGNEHERYDDCVKIFFSGENIRPDFTKADYAITSDLISSPRFYRWPLYNLYGLDIPEPDNSTRDKFCCMVVSNDRCTYRNLFFEELSRFRAVDSGGRYRNNVGGPVSDKLAFLKNYKFCLAFENSSYPGYTTEKLLEAKKSGCVPVYWGNPRVSEDFNEKAFINLHDFPSWKAAIRRMIEIDSDDDLFARMQNEPLVTHKRYTDSDAFGEWLVSAMSLKTDRKSVSYRTYGPAFDPSWYARYLKSDMKNIITRKTGLRRAVRILTTKTC